MTWQTLAFGLAILVAGCAFVGQRSPTPQYYILPTPLRDTPDVTITETIGLLPINLPRYLDRPQISIVEEDGRITLAELHRWAEPLPAGFHRILIQALTKRLPDKAIVPVPSSLSVARTLEVHVQDLTVTKTYCLLTAIWRLRRGEEIITLQRQTITQPVSGQGHAAVASAIAAAIDALAEKIAHQLR